MDILTAYREGLLTDLLPYFHDDSRSWPRRQRYLQQKEGPEPSFWEWLRKLNENYGCDPAALCSVDRLANGGLAVVSGQQAGLLTGPLYTIYKVATSIRFADKMSQELGQPVVPVFWLASEDHDFAEIKAAVFPGSEEPQTLVFPGEYRLTPAAEIPLCQEDVDYVLEQLQVILPETEFTPAVLEMVRDTGSRFESYSDWCGALLSQLFSRQGLVLLDASGAPVRQAAQPIFKAAVAAGDKIYADLAAQAAKLKNLRIKPGLDLPPDHAHLFYLDRGKRIALLRAGDLFVGRRNEVRFTQEQLLAAIETEPASFSPNVVLRPMVQEMVLPVLAMVGGPGEFAYMSQMAPVFSRFNLELPPLVPRLSGTLVEPPAARLLAKYGLGVPDVEAGLEGWLEAKLAASDPIGIDASFDRLRGQISAGYEQLAVELVDSQLGDLKAKNLRKVLEQVQYLHNRTAETHRRQHKLLRQHVQRLETSLPPNQERQYNLIWYLNRYGPGFVDTLAAQDYDKRMILWL
ncbi:MAG: bacillithiol biosynthesis cysteine-adding enzyme BshC [Firmicutes bacterium]|nr:bacillithiol biosynthesis cysteine-adding enzyme BshC [Bacillota bacterium]